MKGKKHTEEQIAFALNQAEIGVSALRNLPENGDRRVDFLPLEEEVQ